MVREREMRIESNTKIADRDIRGEAGVEELVERCIERSGIFLIWPGRPTMMDAISEGLRKRRLEISCQSIMRFGLPH